MVGRARVEGVGLQVGNFLLPMKTSHARILSLGALIAFPLSLRAMDASPLEPRLRLPAPSVVAVGAVGSYVERGTYRIRVADKLGRPDFVLPDGSWAYRGRQVEGTEIEGTLVVRFSGGRVSALLVVEPAVALAWRNSPPGVGADRYARK